jgi:hypothetical protein
MHNVFVIKRGDTSPTLRYLLPIDVSLAGAQVLFQMRKHHGETVIDAPAVIETVFAPAVIAYAWTPSDTDLAGRYQAEFKVTYADRAIETFPNRGFIDVFVAEDVPGLLA